MPRRARFVHISAPEDNIFPTPLFCTSIKMEANSTFPFMLKKWLKNLYTVVLKKFCFVGLSQYDTVHQSLYQKAIQGQDASLHCKFRTLVSSPYLDWYQQHADREPQWILKASKTTHWINVLFKERFSSVLDLGNQTGSLKIESVALQDAAVYYCVLSRTVFCFALGIHTKRVKEVDRWRITAGDKYPSKRFKVAFVREKSSVYFPPVVPSKFYLLSHQPM